MERCFRIRLGEHLPDKRGLVHIVIFSVDKSLEIFQADRRLFPHVAGRLRLKVYREKGKE
jgi:hypothetical protein